MVDADKTELEAEEDSEDLAKEARTELDLRRVAAPPPAAAEAAVTEAAVSAAEDADEATKAARVDLMAKVVDVAGVVVVVVVVASTDDVEFEERDDAVLRIEAFDEAFDLNRSDADADADADAAVDDASVVSAATTDDSMLKEALKEAEMSEAGADEIKLECFVMKEKSGEEERNDSEESLGFIVGFKQRVLPVE